MTKVPAPTGPEDAVEIVEAIEGGEALEEGPALEAGQPIEERFDLGGRSLREHAARGVMINSAFNVALAGVGLLKRVGVAAFLTATEFGFWGLLLVTLMTLSWLKQVGISDKYIQQDERDQVAAFHKAFTLELLYTLCFYALVAVALPLYSLLYGTTDILLPGFILSLALLGSVFQTPVWIFYRQMKFVQQRLLLAIDPIVGVTLTIGLAAAGYGYWSLVIGAVAGTFAAGVVALIASPYPLGLRYDRGTLREYYGFSWPLFFNSVAGLLAVQGAVLVGNWTVGLAGVGAIGLAATFAMFVSRVDGIIVQTIYPAVCAVKARTDLLAEAFVKSNRIGLMWGLPFGIGLALFAPDLVAHVLGGRWEIAEPLLQSFGLILAARQIAFTWTAFMRAVGRTKPLIFEGIVGLGTFLVVTTPLMFVIGLDGYIVGAAIAAVLSLAVRGYFLSRMFAGFRMMRHIARAVAPCVPGVAVVLAMRLVEGGERSLEIAIAELVVYVAVTGIATFLLERSLIAEVVGYVRRAGRRAPAPPRPVPTG